MLESRLPCVAMSDLFDEIGFTDVDVLTIDTEGFDFFLLLALDSRITPIAIELESKSFARLQLATAQRLLTSRGYRVYDANASPDATHWRAMFGMLELFAVRDGPPLSSPLQAAGRSYGSAEANLLPATRGRTSRRRHRRQGRKH